MVNLFKKYLWVFEWVGAAILIGIGITVAIVDPIVYVVTGIILTIFGLFRVIPLVRTTKAKTMKIILTVEVGLNIILGGLLIFFGLKENFDLSTLNNIYGYLLGAILYSRGVIYFLGTSIYQERTSPVLFLAHIAFITLGTWFILSGNLTSAKLGFAILGLAILAALILILHGSRGYKSYRIDSLSKDETKSIKTKEQPIKSDKKDIIVDKEEQKREENIIN